MSIKITFEVFTFSSNSNNNSRGKMGNVAMRVMWPLGVSHKL